MVKYEKREYRGDNMATGDLKDGISAAEKEVIEIQKEIDELSQETKRNRKKKILAEKKLELLEERDSLKDKIDDVEKGIKPIYKDRSLFWNILLLVVLVLIAGGLIAEGRLMGRYAVFILLIVAILILKILDRFKNE